MQEKREETSQALLREQRCRGRGTTGNWRERRECGGTNRAGGSLVRGARCAGSGWAEGEVQGKGDGPVVRGGKKGHALGVQGGAHGGARETVGVAESGAGQGQAGGDAGVEGGMQAGGGTVVGQHEHIGGQGRVAAEQRLDGGRFDVAGEQRKAVARARPDAGPGSGCWCWIGDRRQADGALPGSGPGQGGWFRPPGEEGWGWRRRPGLFAASSLLPAIDRCR